MGAAGVPPPNRTQRGKHKMCKRIITALVAAPYVLVVVAAVAASGMPAEQYLAVCAETQEHGGQGCLLMP
jgi:hypothetical protein